MNILLWRHAEAADGSPDLERALTVQGTKQAARVSHWLSTRLPAGARVLASPALRTRQTAQALDRNFEVDERLAPHRDTRDYLEVIGWPLDPQAAQSDDTVILVGHQPILGWVASTLMTGDAIGWSIDKGALWWLTTRRRAGRHQALMNLVVNPELV